MNALSRRLAAGIAAGILTLVGLGSSPAGAHPRPRATFATRTAARGTTGSGPELTYYGGRVLNKVKVDVVVWDTWSYGRSVPLTGSHSIAGFFGGITASPYLDWLSEYDTPTQHIGRGTLDAVYTIHPPASANGSTVTGAQIGSVLHSMIDTGQLPKPTTNRFYAIFFRSGQTIVTPDGNSADDFCAYHDTMSYASTTAYFAVIPYEVHNRGANRRRGRSTT